MTRSEYGRETIGDVWAHPVELLGYVSAIAHDAGEGGWVTE